MCGTVGFRLGPLMDWYCNTRAVPKADLSVPGGEKRGEMYLRLFFFTDGPGGLLQVKQLEEARQRLLLKAVEDEQILKQIPLLVQQCKQVPRPLNFFPRCIGIGKSCVVRHCSCRKRLYKSPLS